MTKNEAGIEEGQEENHLGRSVSGWVGSNLLRALAEEGTQTNRDKPSLFTETNPTCYYGGP